MSGSPKSTDLTCCISFDFDAMSSWIGSAKSNDPAMVSRGQFGAVALPRILALLRKYSVTGSFAVPGHTAYAYPNLVRAIADDGHEILHHGWVHENPAHLDPAAELEVLKRGIAALEPVVGEPPRGYRSPAWSLSQASLTSLHEHGFLHDSSCMGHDYYPYYLRPDDKWSYDGAYQFDETVELIEMPVSWGLDDFPLSEYVPGFNQGLRPASELEELWRGDFDYALSNAPGGVFVLTLHPQVVGRGNRMLMLERLLDYFSSCKGVHFRRLDDYAKSWKSTNPLATWILENPDLIGKNSIADG